MPRQPSPRQRNHFVAALPAPSTDHRDRLIALRDRLTAELDGSPAAYVAALARQLQAVLSELAVFPDPDAPPSPSDLLVAQREARLAQARQGRDEDDGRA